MATVSTLNISGPIRVGSLPSAPAGASNGFIYYDTGLNAFQLFSNGAFVTPADSSNLVAVQITFNPSGLFNITATDVQNALANLDAAIGDIAAFTPVNYTAVSPGVVESHLAGIDTALGSATSALDSSFRIKNTTDNTKQIAFSAAGITTGTTRTITMPDANVNLALVNTAIQANGSVAFTANQPMGGFILTGLGAGSASGNSVRYEQTILVNGANAFTAAQSMGGFKLTNVASGTVSGDALQWGQIGSANGIAGLDGSGKVPLSQLPSVVMEYYGNWNPNTNTPTLVDGTGTNGFAYRVSTADASTVSGLTDPSMVNFVIGDLIIYNGTVWQKCPAIDGVSSVNGALGAVSLSMASSNGFAGTYSGTALTVSTTVTGILQGNGTAISAASTTGSGAVVLATSPTLVTPALGTPSAVVLTNATGTAAGLTAGTVTTNANLTGPVTSVGNATSVTTNAITNTMLAQMATLTIKGNNTGGTANASDLTVAQVNAILPVFTATLNGLVPLSGGGTLNFLRADGTWTPAGTGSVTSVSVVTANGFAGTVATATSTPAITISTSVTGILQGNGTAISAASTTGSGAVVLATSPTLVTPALGTPSALVGTNITGTATTFTASNVTTNANLTGVITSVGNTTSIAAQTGTGSTFVVQTSPTLITPVIGSATGTSLSVSGQLTSTVVTGTAPLVVSSTTQVANLNAATAGTATNATNVATTQVSNNASYFPLMAASSTNGNQAMDLGTGLTFNPSSNTLTTTAIGASSVTSTGDLTVSANAGSNAVDIISTSVKRGTSSSRFINETYIDSISLAASQTNTTISNFTTAFATSNGMMIDYVVTQATTAFVRIGTIKISCDGTNTAISETYTETGATNLTFSATISGSNFIVTYSSSANTLVMRSDVKTFLV